MAGEPLNPDSEAALSIILDALDGKILDYQGRPFRDILDVSATQTGKSLRSILLPVLRRVVFLRASAVYCLPTMDLLNKVWIDKLKPAIIGAGFGPYIPEKGPGSRGGRPTSLVFVDPVTRERLGSIIFIAGGSGKKREGGQAAVTAGLTLLDEADEYEDAHRVALIEQRAAAFGKDAIKIKSTTIKKDQGSVANALLADSTNSHLEFGCPYCGRYQVLDWANVRYDGTDDGTAEETARIACVHCGVLLDEKDRHKMLTVYRLVHAGQHVNELGEVVGMVPRVSTFGLRTTKLDFHIGYGLPELCKEHRKARLLADSIGDHGLMRSFFRDRLALPYLDDLADLTSRKKIDRVLLANISLNSKYGPIRHDKEETAYSRYWAGSLPNGLEWLTVGCDVQQDRLYWLVMGCDREARTYDLAWGTENACEFGRPANKPELFTALDRMDAITAAGPLGDGWGLPIFYPAIDVGHRQDDIIEWRATHQKWLPIKGVGDEQADRMSGGTMKGEKINEGKDDLAGVVQFRRQVGNWVLGFIEVDTMREQAQSSFLRPPGEPGAAHLPKGLKTADSYVRHLCSRVLVIDPETGKRSWSADPKLGGQFRRDYLDCRTYGYAMMRLRLERLRRESLPKPNAPRPVGPVGKMF